MTVAAVLLAYAACMRRGARMLGQARWAARAPLLAIITYLAAAWSVVAAPGLVVSLTLAVHATALGARLSQLIGACVLRLRDAYATPGSACGRARPHPRRSGDGRTALTAVTHLRAVRQHAVRHAQTARLVGHAEPALGAVLVNHGQPAAYCVAGPHPTVILTTAALQTLDPDQLDAVLAHERAHLASYHHRLLAIAKI